MAKTTSSSPTQNAALLAGLLIILSFVGIYFFLSPQLVTQRTTLESDKSQLAGLQQSDATLLSAQKQLATVQQELTAKGVNFDKLVSVYPATEDMPGLYVQLERLMSAAAAYNVTATYAASSPVVDASGGGSVPLTFSANGSLSDLEMFISSLDQNTRPILLSSISVSDDTSTGAAAGALTLTATGYTLFSQVSSAYSTTPQ